MNPAILGAVRTALSLAVWAALSAILSYFSDATHLSGFMNESVALIVAAAIGALEHSIEDSSGKALFGMTRVH